MIYPVSFSYILFIRMIDTGFKKQLVNIDYKYFLLLDSPCIKYDAVCELLTILCEDSELFFVKCLQMYLLGWYIKLGLRELWVICKSEKAMAAYISSVVDSCLNMDFALLVNQL